MKIMFFFESLLDPYIPLCVCVCESSAGETPNKSSNSQLAYNSFKACKKGKAITVSRLLFVLLGGPLPSIQGHIYQGNSTAAVFNTSHSNRFQ